MSETRPLEFSNASNAGSIRISGSIEAAPVKDLPQGKIGDNGEENGNYYVIMGIYWDYMKIMVKKMETPIIAAGLDWESLPCAALLDRQLSAWMPPSPAPSMKKTGS